MEKKRQKDVLDSEDSEAEEPASEWEEFEGESQNLSLDSIKSKRGRKPVAEQWSRVISLAHDDLKNLRTFELAPDLIMTNAMKATATRGKRQQKWHPIFWPEEYIKQAKSMKVEDNRLTEAGLAKYAKRITKFRKA